MCRLIAQDTGAVPAEGDGHQEQPQAEYRRRSCHGFTSLLQSFCRGGLNLCSRFLVDYLALGRIIGPDRGQMDNIGEVSL
ncbi:MAG TPA: hypothetical protein DEP84_07795 [Chloroflexi bacterium]|nr:hypothetical protein [Chloroflexota bacterium]